ncbi:hypothetical protein ABEG63_07455 [Chryseobacterium sp. C39-AII1]|uniref:hypothetical protein n=1 Tax=Chryseobacterium sp. C39-AII1 TaxID=3080332 RepID=UPI003208D5C4
MKKIISLLSIIILSATVLSCRQDDETELTPSEETIINRTSDINKNSELKKENSESYMKDSINEAEDKDEVEDPPVKNGTHWRIKK